MASNHCNNQIHCLCLVNMTDSRGFVPGPLQREATAPTAAPQQNRTHRPRIQATAEVQTAVRALSKAEVGQRKSNFKAPEAQRCESNYVLDVSLFRTALCAIAAIKHCRFISLDAVVLSKSSSLLVLVWTHGVAKTIGTESTTAWITIFHL